jgi:tetratricopeptide (TPR) repeat protein
MKAWRMTQKNGGAGFAQALRHFQAGRMAEAEAACRAALAASPKDANALNLLAVVLCQRQEFAAAIALLNRVLERNPADLQALRTLGDALEASGQAAAAVETFAKACASPAAGPDLFAKLAASLLEDGRPQEAEGVAQTALGRWPDHLGVSEILGTILVELGRLEEAAAVFRRAAACHPHAETLHVGLGLTLTKLGQFDEAIAAYGTAAALAPARANAWLAEANHQMALVLQGRGQYAAAAAAQQQAVQLRPDSVAVQNNMGLIYWRLRRLDEAIRHYRRAIELDPGFAPAWANLGGALRDADRLEEAIEVLKTAIALAPNAADGHGNLGLVLHDLGRFEEALALYEKARTCDPGHALARLNRAMLTLLNGDFTEGFAEYEWRRKGGLPNCPARSFAEPEWQGEDLAGRTILIHAEQGLGDTLQFCRFVPEVEARGGRVVLEVQRPLVSLVAASFPTATVIAERSVLPPFDCQLPMMSLPWRLGTTLATLPATTPYLAADPAKVALWRERLKAVPGLKVGLVWAGNPAYARDNQRSVPAELLLAQLPREGVSLFSLQKDKRPGDEAALTAHGGIVDLAPQLGDFSDTAAAVSALDLVITIDSAVAHLAGALHRPTWVLLSYALDWRWLRERPDSPWYPSARLFRQSAPRDWPGVLATLSAALGAAADGAAAEAA